VKRKELQMNSQIILATTTGVALSLVSLIVSFLVFKRARLLTQASANLDLWIDEEWTSLSKDLDTVLSTCGEHGRRLALLEARGRAAQIEAKQNDEIVTPLHAKPTITERRHRVLSLARRGQDPQTIAQTLGMPHGEVELMINLGRAA
jgi:hypothetical protein